MSTEEVNPRGSARVGLVALCGLALLGAVALLAARNTTIVTQNLDLIVYLFLALGVVGYYVAVVYLPQVRVQRTLNLSLEREDSVARSLTASLDHLQAGDLLRTVESARLLPDRLATAVSTATRALGVRAGHRPELRLQPQLPARALPVP